MTTRVGKMLLDMQRNRDAVATYHTNAVSALMQSGILSVLKEVSTPNVARSPMPNLIEHMALQAAHSAGYQEALNDIVLFTENFLPDPKGMDALKNLDLYGGLKRCIDNKEITEEEADAIRTGTTPKSYEQHIHRRGANGTERSGES